MYVCSLTHYINVILSILYIGVKINCLVLVLGVNITAFNGKYSFYRLVLLFCDFQKPFLMKKSTCVTLVLNVSHEHAFTVNEER